jgi:hypothetical protein
LKRIEICGGVKRIGAPEILVVQRSLEAHNL